MRNRIQLLPLIGLIVTVGCGITPTKMTGRSDSHQSFEKRPEIRSSGDQPEDLNLSQSYSDFAVGTSPEQVYQVTDDALVNINRTEYFRVSRGSRIIDEPYRRQEFNDYEFTLEKPKTQDPDSIALFPVRLQSPSADCTVPFYQCTTHDAEDLTGAKRLGHFISNDPSCEGAPGVEKTQLLGFACEVKKGINANLEYAFAEPLCPVDVVGYNLNGLALGNNQQKWTRTIVSKGSTRQYYFTFSDHWKDVCNTTVAMPTIRPSYPGISIFVGANIVVPKHFLLNPVVFDPGYYLATNPDVASVFNSKNVDEHWLNYGIREGRRGSPWFSAKEYLARNPDVAAAYKSYGSFAAFIHFSLYGHNEKGRVSNDLNFLADVTYGHWRSQFGDQYAVVKNYQVIATASSSSFSKENAIADCANHVRANPNDVVLCLYRGVLLQFSRQLDYEWVIGRLPVRFVPIDYPRRGTIRADVCDDAPIFNRMDASNGFDGCMFGTYSIYIDGAHAASAQTTFLAAASDCDQHVRVIDRSKVVRCEFSVDSYLKSQKIVIFDPTYQIAIYAKNAATGNYDNSGMISVPNWSMAKAQADCQSNKAVAGISKIFQCKLGGQVKKVLAFGVSDNYLHYSLPEEYQD